MQINRTGSKQLILFICVLLLLWGCETMKVVTDIGTSIAVSQGSISDDQAESIRKSSAAVGKAFTDITPEQEYYIGRAVGASIVGQYKPYTGAAATRYLNLLGQFTKTLFFYFLFKYFSQLPGNIRIFSSIFTCFFEVHRPE